MTSVLLEPQAMKQFGRWFLIRLLIHVVAILHLGYAVYYDYKYVKLPEIAVELRMSTPFGGKFKYLTFLNGLFQTGYYLLTLSCDLYPRNGLRKLRDYLLATFVLPLSLTVSITFWTLYGINRARIYPHFLDGIYPAWLKHTMHSVIVVYALLEVYLQPHRYPRRKKGLTGLGIALGLYLVWLLFVHYWTGVWVYPFLGALFAPLRWFFFVLIVALSFGYYLIGEQLSCTLGHNRSHKEYDL